MKYEVRDVFVVKDATLGTIHKIFGVKAEAEAYLKRIDDADAVIDQWPVEFEVGEE